MRLSEAMKTIRNVINLSQTEVAVRAGLSEGYISQVETGIRTPTIGTLGKICTALGVPLSMVFILMDSGAESMKPYVMFVFKDLWELRGK